jgi:hypothetical protein
MRTRLGLHPNVGQQVTEVSIAWACRRGSEEVFHVGPRVDAVPLRRHRARRGSPDPAALARDARFACRFTGI